MSKLLYVQPALGENGGPIVRVPTDAPEELYRELVALTRGEPFAPSVLLTPVHLPRLKEMTERWPGAELIHAQIWGLGRDAKVWLASPTTTDRK